MLFSAVYKGDRPSAEDVEDHLGYGAGSPFFRVPECVEPGTYPVEGTEEGVPEAFFLAVGGDHPVQHLLAAAVYPAHLVDRPNDERTLFLVKDSICTHAVYLGCGGEYDTPVLRSAHAHDFQVLFEIELKRPKGFAQVVGRLGYARKGQDGVAFSYGVQQPLVCGENVTLGKGKIPVLFKLFEVHSGKIECIDFPVGFFQDPLDEVGPNESICPQYQYIHCETSQCVVFIARIRTVCSISCSVSRDVHHFPGKNRVRCSPALLPPPTGP